MLFGLEHVRKVTQDHVAVKKIFRCVAFYLVAAGVAPGVERAVTPDGKKRRISTRHGFKIAAFFRAAGCPMPLGFGFHPEGIFDSSPMLQLWGLDAERP